MTEQIQNLITQMTVAEKAALCTGASNWTTTPVERLNIPELLVSDGPHGLRRIADIHAIVQESEPATCFPTASSMAATWDTDLLHEVGQALAGTTQSRRSPAAATRPRSTDGCRAGAH